MAASNPESERWTRLHDEARSQYEGAPAGGHKVLWTVVLVVALGVLLFSMVGVFNRFNRIQNEAQYAVETAKAAAATSAAGQAAAAFNATATAFFDSVAAAQTGTASAANRAAETAAPAVISPPATEAVVAPATTPTPLSAVDCLEAQYYTLEVVSGPDLTPQLGFSYVLGKTEPQVQASWTVRNTSGCGWRKIALIFSGMTESITPMIRYEGKSLYLKGSDTLLLPPGAQFEVVVGFRASNARNIDREWILEVNGLQLAGQPHLVIKVENWVTAYEPTKTSVAPRKTPKGPDPTSDGRSGPPPGDTPEPTPPGRP